MTKNLEDELYSSGRRGNQKISSLNFPRPTEYKDKEKFREDLQYKINDFLEEIGYDDLTEGTPLYLGLDNSEMEFIEESERYIEKAHYFKK